MEKEEIMKKTNELAKISIQLGGGPFGCIITKDNEILSENHNRVRIDNDPTQHAEIVAIRETCKKLNTFDLSNCVLYSSCEPCPMCLGAIYWANIKEVYYGNTRKDAHEIGFGDDFIYEEINKSCSDRKIKFIPLSNLYTKEAFEIWKNLLEKKIY
jgi:tRNA(Arg) A34 adenosine deaminase TadA